jgi:hypothetical protein
MMLIMMTTTTTTTTTTIIIIIIIIIIRGWDEVVVCTHPRGIVANIQPHYAQDRPCVMKSHILQEVALFNILAEHGGSRGVNLEKIPQSKACTTVLRDRRRICDGG